MTSGLHFQVHPCGVKELIVEALPEGANREGALYPDGAHITDIKEVRGLLYQMQRPGIAPNVSSPRHLERIQLRPTYLDSSFTPTTGKYLHIIIASKC